MIRVLGIDPGSRITGYAIIDTDGNHSRHIDNGIIRLQGTDIAARCRLIYQGIAGLIKAFEPAEVAIERVFMHKNADSALKLGQARGAAISAAACLNAEIFEYTANQVKQATVGRGHAAKQQVQHMARVLLNLASMPPTDAADALAVALCHAHSRRGVFGLQAGGRRGEAG